MPGRSGDGAQRSSGCEAVAGLFSFYVCFGPFHSPIWGGPAQGEAVLGGAGHAAATYMGHLT